MLAYPIVFERTRSSVIAIVPDIPGAHTEGRTEADAMSRCVGALEEMLAALMADRDDIPEPSAARGRRLVVLPTLTAAKVALYKAMRAQGIRKAELARRLSFNQKQIDRLLDLNHASRMDQIDAALAAIGKRVAIAIKDAA